MRSALALEPAPKRRRVEGEEGGEEGGEEEGEQATGEQRQREVVVRKTRQSALIDVYEQVKFSFERWRMGGLYVDSEALLATSRNFKSKVFSEFPEFSECPFYYVPRFFSEFPEFSEQLFKVFDFFVQFSRTCLSLHPRLFHS